ncbi:hypothetical protein Taro_052437 [Colocasia esculenta]|uniref:Uncharacterized protein n=1 Tax=Colocasia esculenta TaxID=4460 RepID=A0A843XIL1_COLES|nr:hypothetical protein [Colocasia esculenta]
MRGRREEWGKCRAMLGFRVLREGREIPPTLIAWMVMVSAVATMSRQADPSRQDFLSRHIVASRSEGGHGLCRDSSRRELRPESLKVPGMGLQLCGLQVGYWHHEPVVYPVWWRRAFRIVLCYRL